MLCNEAFGVGERFHEQIGVLAQRALTAVGVTELVGAAAVVGALLRGGVSLCVRKVSLCQGEVDQIGCQKAEVPLVSAGPVAAPEHLGGSGVGALDIALCCVQKGVSANGGYS
ncbi:hypothetical protein HEK616_82080 (plasmid) [Streptomyces nigrescens]|uniref:Uncharacterized protein n=2 Tax=Streptomyces TaxID=1883 RepID=A0ABN6RAY7_STRNI|nr:hypothetical protein [Streptomyces nigrescens]MEE4420569.1 hypothetical protein [Streptomyces sp. DSM 41528]BDM74721.1 hypothetical protein HEK616_82080 [Streptomyces nigrescens]